MTQHQQTRTSGSPGVAVCAASFLFMAGQVPALAQDSADAAAGTRNDVIVASLNPVAEGQACSDAAAQAQVSFDFQKPDFEIKQISLYVDGHGVAPDAVDQQWPRVTLSSGLHPGRNTVEIVATGDNDRSIARQLTVLIGVPPQAGDDNAAIVQCDNGRSQVAATPPPATVEPPQPVVEAPPPTVITQTVYVQEPVYVYHPVPAYPVWPVFVPIIPIVIGYPPFPVWYPPHRYCPPPVVSYNPYPPPYRPPPIAYRPPPHRPPPGVNTWRTPNPVSGVPVPVSGVPTPLQPPPVSGGAYRGPRGGGAVYSTQPTSDPRWGVVSDMNQGGTGTRYRTPPPSPARMQPYGGAPIAAPGNGHGQQSYWAPTQPQYGNQPGYHNPPHQSFVHEPPAPRYEAPRPMTPPRMTSAPSNHPPMHGGAY